MYFVLKCNYYETHLQKKTKKKVILKLTATFIGFLVNLKSLQSSNKQRRYSRNWAGFLLNNSKIRSKNYYAYGSAIVIINKL